MTTIPGLTSACARKLFYPKEQADQRFADVGGVPQARIKVQPIRVDATIATRRLYADASSPIASGGRTYRYASEACGLVGTRTIKTGTSGEIYSRQSGIVSNYESLQWSARFGAVITDAALPSIDLGIALLSDSSIARIHIKVNGIWLTASPEEITVLEGGATIISTGAAPAPAPWPSTSRFRSARTRLKSKSPAPGSTTFGPRSRTWSTRSHRQTSASRSLAHRSSLIATAG